MGVFLLSFIQDVLMYVKKYEDYVSKRWFNP